MLTLYYQMQTESFKTNPNIDLNYNMHYFATTHHSIYISFRKYIPSSDTYSQQPTKPNKKHKHHTIQILTHNHLA